ncbi:uncharacterized protein [Pseudochaenichthys georgianus]|uniref:uncharacterized protein n=1 Tax=Pseudochaenichthys georgianus TaxID=52239 RepID=UPI00146DA2F7|nr:uncharacterized protein LOC117447230 [Pseudochaenichthys georgianus]
MAKEKNKTGRESQTQKKAKNNGGKESQGRKLNQWRQDRMRGAIEEYQQIIEDGGVPQLRLLARAWSVPKSTLQRRVKGNGHFNHMIGRKPFLPEKDEAELEEMIATLGKRGFPLRLDDIRTLAFQFAEKKGIKGFSQITKKAGYRWFQGFLRRNPKLSMRKPEALSAARAAGFNPTVVNKWFEKYKDTIETLGLKNVPGHIWNCDETGLQDHFLSTRVVAEVGAPCFEVTGTLPVRERPTTSRQRAKPPSYSLTSDSHFAFLKEKGGKKKEKKLKPKEKKTAQVIQEACAICQYSYGDRKDPKSTEEWLSCAVCFQWFHESCAEDNGVLDDDGSLTCKDCLFPDM